MDDAPVLPDIPRPSQLWKQLSSERKLRAAAEDFWRDNQAANEQTEALLTIAQRIKFRVSSVLKMPREKKAKQLIALPAVSETVAARLLVAYHLGQQRPMMGAFLDALGIKHEEGLIADEELSAPAVRRRCSPRCGALGQAYPADDVARYLTTLVWQDPIPGARSPRCPRCRPVARPRVRVPSRLPDRHRRCDAPERAGCDRRRPSAAAVAVRRPPPTVPTRHARLR